MTVFHDNAAAICGDVILSRIRSGDADFQQIFSSSITRTGDWDWPRPDYVCFDEGIGATYALEFKPPYQSKREYLTGLGQSLAYLQKHTYSGLIIPYYADDNFKIAEFIQATLDSPEFCNVATSLFAYKPESFDIDILKKIKNLRSEMPATSKYEEVKTFWCWWRDVSQYEIYDMLNLSFLHNDAEGDIYSNYIFPKLYDMMLNKKTMQWDGTPRNKASAKSKSSEKQNYRIPLFQLDLLTRSEGRLTALGLELLHIGKLYGVNSKRFMDKLAYIILVNGRHLELIEMVIKFNKNETISKKEADYRKQLDEFLTNSGCIGKRKPTARTTGGKKSYIRDEPKLWRKFGLLEMRNANSYFHPGEGYKFDHERIHNILLSDK